MLYATVLCCSLKWFFFCSEDMLYWNLLVNNDMSVSRSDADDNICINIGDDVWCSYKKHELDKVLKSS